MPHWKKRFPSTYLQAADLDSPLDVTIKTVLNEMIGSGERAELKPVITFREKGIKPVVLNMTRSEAIERIAASSDDDDWGGVRIRLQRGTTRYQGKTVDCIDVVPSPVAATKRPPRQARSAEPEPDDPMPTRADDSEDPF